MRVIDVNFSGEDAKGDTFDQFAAEEMILKGYMINVPVIQKYPNGDLVEGNEVLITQNGIEFLRRELPLDFRDVSGNA